MKSIEASRPEAVEPSFSVRPAGVADAAMISRVLTECFHPPVGVNAVLQPWIQASLRVDLARRLERPVPYHTCLIALAEGIVVGTLEVAVRGLPQGWWVPPVGNRERLVYVSNLGVTAPWRRRGVARQLLLECETIARRWSHTSIRLHVMADNHKALGLYRSLGYTLERSEREFPVVGPLKLLLHKRLDE